MNFAAVIVIAVIVSKTVYRMQKNRLEDSLKREWIDRGFSAEEIERIIQAKPDNNPQHSDT